MKKQRIILTENQAEILKGESIINTLYSLLDDPNFHNYDILAIKQLIKKFTKLI